MKSRQLSECVCGPRGALWPPRGPTGNSPSHLREMCRVDAQAERSVAAHPVIALPNLNKHPRFATFAFFFFSVFPPPPYRIICCNAAFMEGRFNPTSFPASWSGEEVPQQCRYHAAQVRTLFPVADAHPQPGLSCPDSPPIPLGLGPNKVHALSGLL